MLTGRLEKNTLVSNCVIYYSPLACPKLGEEESSMKFIEPLQKLEKVTLSTKLMQAWCSCVSDSQPGRWISAPTQALGYACLGKAQFKLYDYRDSVNFVSHYYSNDMM